MPSARALQTVSNLPPTPGRQVKHLKSELEKKETENENLKANVADLTKALDSLQLVKDNAAVTGNAFNKGEETKKKGKTKDLKAPQPAMTAYRYYCEDIGPKTEDKSFREMWKECQGDARKKYTDMAATDKKRFEEENAVYQTKLEKMKAEEHALQLYYEKQKQDMAMQFFEAHIQAQNAVNAKSKKKVKDQDAPKGATSSFLFFCQDKREGITKQNPDKTPTEISKILGEEWGKLQKGKRGKNGTKKYDDMAAKDKARYNKEKAAYDILKASRNQAIEQERAMQLQKDKEEAMKMMKEAEMEKEALKAATQEANDLGSNIVAKSKKKTKPSGPKKPSSAYIFFTTENRARIMADMGESVSQQELLSEVGRQWRLLSEDKKKPYVDLALKDKERYQQEMEALM